MKENNKKVRSDLFREVTDRIMQSLEKGVVPWVKPWTPNAAGIPCSGSTGYYYRGINRVLLSMVQDEQGYSSNRWFTYPALKAAGGTNKGQKGTMIVFFKPIEQQAQEHQLPEADEAAKDEEERWAPSDFNELKEDGPRKRKWFVKRYCVWNRDQIKGLPKVAEQPADGPREILEAFKHARADRIVEGSGAEIQYGGGTAFFNPGGDYIQIPEPASFKEPGGYHSTRFHELTHWTGHASRLAREFGWHQHSEDYAKEELVAEMGSAFFCDWCDIQSGLQHPEYISAWLKILGQDSSAVVVAATLAQKAVDFVFEKAGIDADFAPSDCPDERQEAA